ncbi:hypothetical protein QYE76_013703 [Lolium multiflorum]|uniref:Transposase n=1 Tax=Lolium multiflorum TaxID=4521 RepID=A0AAD8X552_LOLMU|nr:hypothetical protein QYE76_013703 [Lolium multiflorum]
MLEDHKTLLYPNCEDGQKKLGTTLELLQWKAENGFKSDLWKGSGGQSVPNVDGHVPMWKKKSIFWELPYWKFLEVHSAIDVMHVTKNLCVNLLNFLGVYGKTKDTPDARQDQQSIHEGSNLNPEKYQGPVPRSYQRREGDLFEVLSSIKVPSGFSSNIKGIINMSEKKFQNLKSHDCHVIMTQLLPVALRGLLPENVRVPIVKLCAFLNAISQKVINPLTLQNLQKDVLQCLVSFELVFPPSFFNIMTHLLVHLVEEIGVLGPVFLHNMFPFERFMGVLKKYVHNRARPEGSISKGYGTEEVIEFCVDFIPDLKPIGVPESRYEGRLRGKGTLGKKAITCMDGHSFTQAHYTVLHNSILVAPYKEEHKDILRSKYPEEREDWIDGEHMKTFGGWLQTRLMNATDDEQLYLLAKQPSSTISTFQGYEINGNTFYTFAQDKKSINQNSGVRFDAADDNGKKVTYYGYIEEIWELEYGPNLKVPLFRCKWFNLKDGVQVDPQYGMTIVDLKNLGYDTEPFVLASEVAQFQTHRDPRRSSPSPSSTHRDALASTSQPRRRRCSLAVAVGRARSSSRASAGMCAAPVASLPFFFGAFADAPPPRETVAAAAARHAAVPLLEAVAIRATHRRTPPVGARMVLDEMHLLPGTRSPPSQVHGAVGVLAGLAQPHDGGPAAGRHAPHDGHLPPHVRRVRRPRSCAAPRVRGPRGGASGWSCTRATRPWRRPGSGA